MLLDARHTRILAILVLFAGRWVNRRVPWLRDYGIPEPVTGGILASLALTPVQLIAGIGRAVQAVGEDRAPTGCGP